MHPERHGQVDDVLVISAGGILARGPGSPVSRWYRPGADEVSHASAG